VEQWERSEPESEHSYVNVSGLTRGQTYELRVVALGRIGNRDDVTSETQRVYVGPPRGQLLAQTMYISLTPTVAIWVQL